MDKFIWTPEYGVGVQIIDEQHRNFFAIANRLIDLSHQENPAKEDLILQFSELGNYALYHLSTEEIFFREFNYEDAPAHIAAHDAYRDMIASHFTNAISDPNVDIKKLAEEMALYSGTWLQQHILVMDKKFTAVFHMHGFT